MQRVQLVQNNTKAIKMMKIFGSLSTPKNVDLNRNMQNILFILQTNLFS